MNYGPPERRRGARGSAVPLHATDSTPRPVRRPIGAAIVALLLLTGAAVPNDPLAGNQAHLGIVRAFEAWDVRRGEGAVVAVLDTGVDLDHPDLAGRLVEGIDLVERDTPPDDPHGHGTLVAGIIAAVADNGRGVVGVAPQALVMPIRVLDERGRGSADVVAEGIRHAVSQEVDVINLSLAEVKAQDEMLDLALVANRDVQQAIAEAAAAGIIVVAAAGNDGEPSTPYEPDAPVIVVGASAADDTMWAESNHDDRTLFAPGTDIHSTWSQGGGYARADGTSFATPIVAAGAAMLAGAGLDAAEVTRRLTETAVDIGVGLGRVDLASAVDGLEAAPTPTATPIPPPVATEPAPPPATMPPVDDEGALEPVQEVLGPPPDQVTEAPPPIATIPDDAAGQPLQPLDVPLPTALPTRTATPTPTTALRTQPAPMVLKDDGVAATRITAIPVAWALLAADVALAGWLLTHRREDS